MNQQFGGWNKVAERLREIADSRAIDLNDGQVASLREIAKRLPNNGVIIADEVGMGKTRIAASVANAVIAAGGRVAILVPPGLGYQWGDELRNAGVDAPLILRSLLQYLKGWENKKKPAPWFQESTLVISHSFTNWRLSENAVPWRWSLLPAVLKLLTKEARKSGRVRVGTNSDKFDHRIDAAAQSIFKEGPKDKLQSLLDNEVINQWGDDSPLFEPANYTKETEFRSALERVVGAGLGIFDLIIIDEAHKSRGPDSGLNRLIAKVVGSITRF